MINVRRMTNIAFFAGITAILSLFSIPIPLFPVPLTLSLVAVFLCATVLRPADAAFAQVIYLLLGAAGLPVFAGFKGGLAVLVGPTGGFLLAYPVMAAAASYIIQVYEKRRTDNRRAASILWTTLALMPALLICYTMGTAHLALITGLSLKNALMAGVVPFVVFDVLKAAIVSLLARELGRLRM